MAARTQAQEAALTVLADAKIKADAVAELAETRSSEMATAQVAYGAGVKAARDKFDAAVIALEK